ncbi:MAG: SAM-dependent DNA methyltransferase [Thermoplasmataceae archaeon]
MNGQHEETAVVIMAELKILDAITEKTRRRSLGYHLTPVDVTNKYILPEIRNQVLSYSWTDNFCGDGNLIFPILGQIEPDKRASFFRDHLFLSDIRPEAVENCRETAMKYGIPEEYARRNIFLNDGLASFPMIRTKHKLIHITNPPYLYLGYISKTPSVKHYLKYFQNGTKGLQDLYQIALYRDIEAGLEKMIYIVPSNFLYGNSVSSHIRNILFSRYTLEKAIIIEKRIFEFTGTNITICFFRKSSSLNVQVTFPLVKAGSNVTESEMTLERENSYRAGSTFFNTLSALRRGDVVFRFYLLEKELLDNPGYNTVLVTDASRFNGRKYVSTAYLVNDRTSKKISENLLFLKTLDSGSVEGRCGLYRTADVFGTQAIMISGSPYRTHPIQLMIENVSGGEQEFMERFFNLILEHYRKQLDSEFMTTYRYSNSNYTRKYLGLNQAKLILDSYPLSMTETKREKFHKLVLEGSAENVIRFLRDEPNPRLCRGLLS